MSSFENDLKFEQENQERYDRFYKGFCGFSMIIRTDYSTEAGRNYRKWILMPLCYPMREMSTPYPRNTGETTTMTC